MRDGFRSQEEEGGELCAVGGGEEGFVEAAAVAQVVGGVVAGEVEDVRPEFGDGGWVGFVLWKWGGGWG